jgi:multiple sugar transport system ATP-binding protein
VLDLPVAHTERTGSDATGYLRWGEGLLALRVEPERAARLAPGQTVRVAFPPGKASLFDARTGDRL